MAQKSLKELLYKYVAPEEYKSILEAGLVTRSRVDQDKRLLEVYADFDYIIPKSTLYALETEVKDAYKLNSFKLFPHYPSSLFCYDYIPDILRETEREGFVARGFFSDYTYTLEGNALNVKIGFPKNGVMLLERAETPRVIENIIKSIKITNPEAQDATLQNN